MSTIKHCDVCGMIIRPKMKEQNNESYLDKENKEYKGLSLSMEAFKNQKKKSKQKYSINVQDICETCKNEFENVSKCWERKRKQDIKILCSNVKIR